MPPVAPLSTAVKRRASYRPCFQGLEALVTGLLFQTADCRVASSGQGHGTQHQAGDGLYCQHVQLGTLKVLLATRRMNRTSKQGEDHENMPKKKVAFVSCIHTAELCTKAPGVRNICGCKRNAVTSCCVSSSWSIVMGWVTSTPNKVAQVSSN